MQYVTNLISSLDISKEVCEWVKLFSSYLSLVKTLGQAELELFDHLIEPCSSYSNT